jgi:hypothetical protein
MMESFLGSAPAEAIAENCMAQFDQFDWQAFVPVALRDAWPQLSPEARAAIYLFARDLADHFDPPSD